MPSFCPGLRVSSLLAIAALVLVTAITPGPNNLVVMRKASRAGLIAALPSVLGVVCGSVALLAVVAAGAGFAFTAWPPLRLLIGIGGAGYLVWLGLGLICASRGYGHEPKLPSGTWGLFGFQFLNPKAWVMVLTVVASSRPGGPFDAFTRLAPLFIVIPAACLLLWASLGVALSSQLARPAARLWSDRLLGVLLIVSAPLMFV